MEAHLRPCGVGIDDVDCSVRLDYCCGVPDAVVVRVAGDDPRGAWRAREACAGLGADGYSSDGPGGDANFRLWK